ncbi:MAG TPA: hypothetical protein VM580_22900 [Labilithrix sp.]|nr:hypothetical protein [Labilithrix sp.]
MRAKTGRSVLLLFPLLVGSLVFAGAPGSACPSSGESDESDESTTPLEASATRVSSTETAILFERLGARRHRITTRSALAQRYFDQGLALTYAFNDGEAIRSFEEAARLDPSCAMAYWGIALALGPSINQAMLQEAVPKARRAIEEARKRAPLVTDKERAYIEALASRYSHATSAVPAPRDYADAMRDLHARYPDDSDAATLFAAALMEVHPWQWWRNERPTPEVEEAIGVLEAVLEREPLHLGANHYHIHALETAPEPLRALPSADRLRDLAPQAGHLLHMPSHIYLRAGLWNDASRSNADAIRTDRAFVARRGYASHYVQFYYPHNINWFVFSTLMEGRSAESLAMARMIADEVKRGHIDTTELLALPMFVRVRFACWDDILAEAAPPSTEPAVRLVWHYARGMAYAARGELEQARRESKQVEELAMSDPAGLVAHDVLEAEISRRRGALEPAIERLEAAVERAAALGLVPLPRWYYPVRQSLGAALLEAGRASEAERVFRQDLEQYPANGWGLFGLARSLEAQGRESEAASVGRAFRAAWIRADVELGPTGVVRR